MLVGESDTIKSIDEALIELKKVNNNLSLLMKQKKALQSFIQEESDLVKKEYSNKARALKLKKDVDFIKEHGRERTSKEIARIMGYSERQVQRFLKEDFK